MLGALVGVLALSWRGQALRRGGGIVLLAGYPLFVIAALTVR
jgi:hypothetical protein